MRVSPDARLFEVLLFPKEDSVGIDRVTRLRVVQNKPRARGIGAKQELGSSFKDRERGGRCVCVALPATDGYDRENGHTGELLLDSQSDD